MYPDENYGRDKRYRREISQEELRAWYQRYYQRGMSLKEVGRRVGVNPRHLSQLFKEAGLPVTLRIEDRVLSPKPHAQNPGS
jgi:transposase-like protein